MIYTVSKRRFRRDEPARKVREMFDSPGPSKGPIVLVVDDETSVRSLLRDVLAHAGYTVLEAENGADALGILAKMTVELMITDLVMPEKEGLETIGEARKRYPGMKIISMSGAFGGHYMKMASFLGADARVAKPIDFAELLKTVRGVLAT